MIRHFPSRLAFPPGTSQSYLTYVDCVVQLAAMLSLFAPTQVGVYQRIQVGRQRFGNEMLVTSHQCYVVCIFLGH